MTDPDENLTLEDIQCFRQFQYKKLDWSQDESNIRYFRDRKERIFSQYSLPFTEALVRRLTKTVFRIFLDALNPQQNQDPYLQENKLAMYEYDLKKMPQRKLHALNVENQLFDTMINTLRNMIQNKIPITIRALGKIIASLRICDYYTNSVDIGLQKFDNLQVLVLIGNNIRNIEGSYLPRKLRFLELYNNFLSSLVNFVKGAPRGLVHLGLGRNCLDDNSSLHLFKNQTFSELHSLDLSDNDICDLTKTLNILKSLKELRSLQLEGNPCYLEVLYTNQVFPCFSNLIYLDNTQILQKDRTKVQCYTDYTSQELSFQCYRIMSLPKPPKNKKNIQTIHVEVSIPLLEQARKVEVDKAEEEKEKVEIKIDLPAPQPKTDHKSETSEKSKTDLKKAKLDKKKSKTDMKTSKSKIQKSKKDKNEESEEKPKKQNLYTKDNEYNETNEKNNFSFKSPRMKWNRIMEFPEVAIDVSKDDFKLLRDVLRTKVTVKVVYLTVLPPKKEKKTKRGEKKKSSKGTETGKKHKASKGNQKGEKEGKASKGSKKNKIQVSKTKVSDKKSEEFTTLPEEPKDIIVSKVTLLSFSCNLEPINWSDETIDYFWADHKKLGDSAMRIGGSLKDLIFRKPPKAHPKMMETASLIDNAVQKIPKIPTVHLGLGLKRDLFRQPSPHQSHHNMFGKISSSHLSKLGKKTSKLIRQ